MSNESLEEFYSQIPGFEWPWEVQEIIRDDATRASSAESTACFRSRSRGQKGTAASLSSWSVMSAACIGWPLSAKSHACSTLGGTRSDETSFHKRLEYVTMVLDKDRAVVPASVLDVLWDRKAETLGDWFRSQETADVKGLESSSMDMQDPSIKAVRENFENWDGMVAFDRCHVAQHLNKVVDKVRMRDNRKLAETHGASELSGTKFEWLNTSSRTDNRTARGRAFMQLSRQNLKTARAWRIKEKSTKLRDYGYPAVAESCAEFSRCPGCGKMCSAAISSGCARHGALPVASI